MNPVPVAGTGDTLPVARFVRRRLGGAAPAEAVAGALRGQPGAVAFTGAWAGGPALLSSHPLLVADPDADPFELIGTFPLRLDVKDAGVGAVGGGWFGWLGFGLARRLEPIPPPPPRSARPAEFGLAFHDHVIRRDRDGHWWFEALETVGRRRFLADRYEYWQSQLSAAGERGSPAQAAAASAAADGRTVLAPVGAGLAGHHAAVRETVGRIRAGELSQANICMAFEGSYDGDPVGLWQATTSAIHPQYGAYIAPERAGHGVLSLSPELFLRRAGRAVETKPIKGTAPIGSDPALLAADPKNRAENVMIVDLMRNDLGRVCEYGTVRVTDLCAIKAAAGVWHLESGVRGELRPEVTDADLLRAVFPPGSVTGAPKVQALRTIHELEGTARDAYCGAVGMISPLSGLEFNVAIRTFELFPGTIRLSAGGGIVADSAPDAEVTEVLHKARGVADPAGFGVAERRGRSATPCAVSRADRPDPSRGVCETLLVSARRPLYAADHLSRLSASCRSLGIPVPPTLADELSAHSERTEFGAIRVDVGPNGIAFTSRPAPQPGPVRLHPLVLPGGLGAHKWADRRLVSAHTTPDTAPLICDIDGAVLEAGHAAIAIVNGRELIAPPQDGRILPSLTRARAFRLARAAGWDTRSRALAVGDLCYADAIVLFSSLRGPHLGILGAKAASRSAVRAAAELSDLLRSAVLAETLLLAA